MTFAQKVSLALVTTLFSPAAIALVAFGRWSRDNVDVSLPAVIYLLPLLLVGLTVGRHFRAKRLAVGIYAAGMGVLLILAIATLWSELHGPVFAQIYVPTIGLSFPFGLMAILHGTTAKKNA